MGDIMKDVYTKDVSIVENRAFRATFSWEKLQRLIKDELMSYSTYVEFLRSGSRLPSPEIKITVRQLKEGSPDYPVSKWEATIECVQTRSEHP